MSAMETNEAVTLGVVVARLEDLRKDFAEFRQEIRQAEADKVTRPEFEEYKKSLGRRLDEIDSRRAPWWAVASVIAAIATVVWNIISSKG